MIGYIAKDKNGEVYLHVEKPYYDNLAECWFSTTDEVCITGEFPEFNNITCNDEPIKVEIKLERI